MRPEMTEPTLETSLMLHVEQITDGKARCTYCDKPATMTTANGADPEPEPVCGTHAAAFIETALLSARTFLD